MKALAPPQGEITRWFSLSLAGRNFESYRMLGAHTMEKLCTDRGGDFRCFIRDILKRQLKMEAPDWLAKFTLTAPDENNAGTAALGACLKYLEFSCYGGYD